MKTDKSLVAQVSILLVEDEEVPLEILTSVLSRKFPDNIFHTAQNGRAGLEIFKVQRPALVITDLNMPELNGVQMVEKIREIEPATRFIIVSGDAGTLPMEQSMAEAKIDYFFAKPVCIGSLFTAIEKCLELSRKS
jgi:YesN/AraC family two-component response regulator